MKKRLLVFLILLLVSAGVFLYLYKDGIFFTKIFGGKGVSEGLIEYDITYPKMDPNSMMASGMPNKAYLRFKNNRMVNDMSGMMGLICITYISDPATKGVKQSLVLFGSKYVADISTDELKKMNSTYIDKIEKGKNVRQIAGFKCKEALVTLKDKTVIHVYYTNDIGIVNPNWSNPYSQIDGVLMDFEMERYGISMHLQAKAVLSQKIEEPAFIVPDDFKKVSLAKLEDILVQLNQ